MNNNSITKVAIYTRVSTIQQVEEGFSLEAQKDKLIKLAESNNYSIYKIYEELGKSGKNTNRPAFQEMMNDMKEHKFSKIMVMKLDRISRSVSDLENIIKELQENNCGFESASEKIDTTSAMGLMFIRLLGIFAQFERERISERIKDVFAEKVQHGGATTGMLPIGYKVGINDKGEKIVVKDKEKEEFAMAIFDTYEQTSSLIKTAIYLNENYPDLVYKGGFNTIDIKRIMTNTLYYGYFKGNENYCEPYLTYERWKKINDMRESKNLKNPKKYTYLFSGMLINSCGHRMAGSRHITRKKELKFYYRCSKYAHSGNCSNNMIFEEVIESAVLNALPGCIDEYLYQYELNYSQQKNNADKLKKSMLKLEEEKKRIINSYNKGWITEEEAEQSINEINETLKNYKIPEDKDLTYLKELRDIMWIDIYKDLTRENKQLFFRKIIDYIDVDVEGYRKGKEDFIKIHLIK